MIRINNILVPTDLSDYAGYALDYAREFASAYGAKLHLLHVFDLPWMSAAGVDLPVVSSASEMQSQYELDVRSRLETIRGEIEGLEVRTAVDTDVAHVSIIRYAKNHDVDLIVLATHGRTGITHALIGSVAEKVVQMAPCPVLTVKHPEHEFVLP